MNDNSPSARGNRASTAAASALPTLAFNTTTARAASPCSSFSNSTVPKKNDQSVDHVEGDQSSLETEFQDSKTRVQRALLTVERSISRTRKEQEREILEIKEENQRLLKRLELTRELVCEGEVSLAKSERSSERAKEELSMLRTIVDEKVKNESTNIARERRERKKQKQAREQLDIVREKLKKISGMFNGDDDDDDDIDNDSEDDDDNTIISTTAKTIRTITEEEEAEKNTRVVEAEEAMKNKRLVKHLSNSLKNLEAVVLRERNYRKMANSEVELARTCVDEATASDAFMQTNADLKIAYARLTLAQFFLSKSTSSAANKNKSFDSSSTINA